jgi:hypothetical protein
MAPQSYFTDREQVEALHISLHPNFSASELSSFPNFFQPNFRPRVSWISALWLWAFALLLPLPFAFFAFLAFLAFHDNLSTMKRGFHASGGPGEVSRFSSAI